MKMERLIGILSILLQRERVTAPELAEQAEESKSSYGLLFQTLKDRGLATPKLVISGAHSGLLVAIQESFPAACWQRSGNRCHGSCHLRLLNGSCPSGALCPGGRVSDEEKSIAR